MTEERNQEIGQELQKARLDRGLSLDDVQQQTKIQKRYLQAIEAGNFDQLPGAFYERAFVRQYAGAVGLDVAQFMAEHDIERQEVEPDLSAARVDADNVTRTGMRFEEETAAEKTRQYLPRIIIGAVIVIVIAVIWAVVANFAGRNTAQSTSSSSVAVTSEKVSSSSADSSSKKASSKSSSAKSSSETKKTAVAAPVVSTTTASTSTVEVTPADSTKEMVLHLATTGQAWIQVTDNTGATLYSGTMAANGNQDVTIPATSTAVTVRSGNVTGTKITIDGQDVTTGATGTVWNTVLNIKR